MKSEFLSYILALIAIIIFSGIYDQSFALKLDAEIYPSKNIATATFIGDRQIILKYPLNSNLAKILDGNNNSISFSLDSSDSGNGLNAVLDKINEFLIYQKLSFSKFENATLSYRASINGGPENTTISYQVELHPIITDLAIELDGISTFGIDIDWRSIVLDKPLVVNTQEYGQIDINHPIGSLRILDSILSSTIEPSTVVSEIFNTPILDFEVFEESLNDWSFSINENASNLNTINNSNSHQGYSKIISAYDFGKNDTKIGDLSGTKTSILIDGENVDILDSRSHAVGQMKIEGFSKILTSSYGSEFLLVNPEIPEDYDPEKSNAYEKSEQEQTGAWKTFIDSSTGLSLQYPHDSFLSNGTGTVFLDPGTLEDISVLITLLDEKMISSMEKNLSLTIPWSDNIDQETINRFAKFSIDTAFNNTGALLIEDITTQKWSIEGKNITSYMLSTILPDKSYMRSEHILFTNPQMNKLIDVTTSPPISDQTIPETEAIIKKIIESINF